MRTILHRGTFYEVCPRCGLSEIDYLICPRHFPCPDCQDVKRRADEMRRYFRERVRRDPPC